MQPVWAWALRLLLSAAVAGAALGCARLFGLDASALGLCRPQRGGAMPLLCCVAAAAAFSLFSPASAAALPAGGGALALAFLQLCLAAPLAEELVFRGAIMSALRPLGAWAVAAQAVLFALAHEGLVQQAYALVFGLALGWLARRTKSLWPGAAVHAANNALVFAILWSKGATP